MFTAYTTQVISPFGSGYVHEHHSDQTDRYLARGEIAHLVKINGAVNTLTAAMFDELLNSLRGALSLRRGA